MIAEIAGVIVIVGGLLNVAKTLPEITDRARRRRFGQKIAQMRIQLSQIVESGYEILNTIERHYSNYDDKTKNILTELLHKQSMRIRTFAAILIDPDTKDMLEALDPKLRKQINRTLSSKRLHIYSDLDSFSRPIYHAQLKEIYNTKRLKEIRGRLEQLESKLLELSSVIKENVDLNDLV